jgi:dihydroorotase
VSNTKLVKDGHMTLNQLIDKMSAAPAKLLGVEGGELTVGSAADIVVLDPDREIVVDANKFVSRGHNTPFHGKTYYGAVCATIVGGRVIDQE